MYTLLEEPRQMCSFPSVTSVLALPWVNKQPPGKYRVDGARQRERPVHTGREDMARSKGRKAVGDKEKGVWLREMAGHEVGMTHGRKDRQHEDFGGSPFGTEKCGTST